MRFGMLDRITELVPGERITAERKLTGREDYLADHFPRFPVMPGVLMLEAMYQAAAWLVRVGDDFEHSIVRLKEARNVKYSDFVEKGDVLIVKAEIKKREGLLTSLECRGFVHGDTAVSCRLVLETVQLDQLAPNRTMLEPWARKQMRDKFLALSAEVLSQMPVSA
jgi:3-hydroxyacyl-[acyl-carrier-protein] dehydratase